MMSKNKLKEIDIKDRISYYFDQIINIKSRKKIMWRNSYFTTMDMKHQLL